MDGEHDAFDVGVEGVVELLLGDMPERAERAGARESSTKPPGISALRM